MDKRSIVSLILVFVLSAQSQVTAKNADARALGSAAKLAAQKLATLAKNADRNALSVKDLQDAKLAIKACMEIILEYELSLLPPEVLALRKAKEGLKGKKGQSYNVARMQLVARKLALLRKFDRNVTGFTYDNSGGKTVEEAGHWVFSKDLNALKRIQERYNLHAIDWKTKDATHAMLVSDLDGDRPIDYAKYIELIKKSGKTVPPGGRDF